MTAAHAGPRPARKGTLMTLAQACHAKKIIIIAVATAALAGCGKVAASTAATSSKPAAATSPTAAARDARLAKTYDMTFNNLTYSTTSGGTVTSMSYDYSDGTDGRLVVATTTPEPATLGVLGVAVAGLMIRRRR